MAARLARGRDRMADMKTLPEGFVQAIRDNPEDDALRLIAADWLDENGHEAWAELVRLQIALASGQILDNGQDEKRLLRMPFAAPFGTSFPYGFCWRRGFVEEITMWWEDFSKRHKRILKKQPIRKVALHTLPEVEWRGDPFKGKCAIAIKGHKATHLLGWVHQDGLPRNCATSEIYRKLLKAEWPLLEFVQRLP